MVHSSKSAALTFLALLGLLAAAPACNRTADDSEASTVLPDTPDIDARITKENELIQSNSGQSQSGDRGTGEELGATPQTDTDAASSVAPGVTNPPDVPLNQLKIADQNATTADQSLTRQLSSSLTPVELQAFLADADKDLEQAIRTAGNQPGQDDLQAAKNIAQAKLQGARQLANHADASDAERVLGRRGELQSLSHLAQLRDVNSAKQLEVLAQEYADDEAEDLRVDARLVMIGFALERLRNGVDDSQKSLLELNEELVDAVTSDNVMAMMAMGQSRDWLARLEHTSEAKRVRDLIRQKFGQSKDPQIAEMAASYAGAVQFDEISSLVDSIAEGQTVAESRWRDAVNELVEVEPDLRSVQYLCGTTLECEASGQPNLAAITYEVLREKVATQDNAMGQEAQVAIDLHEARQSRIGKPLNETLVPVSSDTPTIDSLRGRVVLVPFWSGYVSESLLLIPLLQQLEQQNPDRVTVVGINVDPLDPNLASEMAKAKFDFASYQTKFDASLNVSPVAAKYGLGGHPMTVILNQEGNVAAITFGEKQISSIVDDLLR